MSIPKSDFFSCSHPTFASLKVYNGVKKVVSRYDRDSDEVKKRLWLGLIYPQKKFPDLTVHLVDHDVGLGLYAKSAIRAEAVVGEYTGLVKRYRWLATRRKNYIGEYTLPGYPVKYIIDAEKYGSQMRYVNHSSDPNLYAITVIVEGILRIFFIAKRPIVAGEQLLIDYGPSYWRYRRTPQNF